MIASLFQSRRFWVPFAILNILFFIYALYMLPKAIPLIEVNITMDRDQAIKVGRQLMQEQEFVPADGHVGTSFETDSITKNFIELEGGGTKTFIDMVKQEWYMPYLWHVRFFKEYQPQETHIFFTPSGQPYGFKYRLAEEDLLPSLNQTEAQQLAEDTAQKDWGIDLTPYALLESGNKKRPNGRVDYSFVYQRTDRDLNEGKYRLKLRVTGNRFTRLRQYIHVPQEFILHYREMRSANNTIANAASVFAYIFYILCIAVIGLFYLISNRTVIWKWGLVWGFGISFAQFLVNINKIPLDWMYYSTHHPMASFILNNIVDSLYSMCINTVLLTLIITAAEGLSRIAFGDHIQLWRTWAKGVGNTYQSLGTTLGGTLFAGFDLAFAALFGYLSHHYLGWWSPISNLSDPDILAEYVPWFSAIAISLQAAFIEECKYRALPLAAAALIGRRLKCERLFIIVTLLLQAVVFGAVHANYATIPAYARIVEIFVPAVIWGVIYLRFGLIPTVITHYIYDIFWFALPIFIIDAPYTWLYKLCIIICALAPLSFVLYRRMQAGGWVSAAYDAYNKGWQVAADTIDISRATTLKINEPTYHTKACLVACAISLFVWGWYTTFTTDAPPLAINREQTIDLAQERLTQQFSTFAQEQSSLYPVVYLEHTMPGVSSTPGKLQHTYVWQTYGKDRYHDLIGSFLYPASWHARFLQFNGDAIARAYQFSALVGATSDSKQPTYDALVSIYNIPEIAPGSVLSEQEARIIADRTLVDQGIDLADTTLVHAVARKHPNRQDWTFTYAHKQILPNEEARTIIVIHGDQVHCMYREVHVPEAWARQENRHNRTLSIFMTLVSLLLRILFIGGAIYGLLQWAYKKIPHHIIGIKFTTFALISGLSMINSFIQIIATFNTQEPFANQLFTNISSNIFYLLLRCGIFTLVAAMLMSYRPVTLYAKRSSSLLSGITAGLIIAAFMAFIGQYKPSLEPVWANYDALLNWSPIIGFTLKYTLEFLITCMAYATIFRILSYLCDTQRYSHLLAVVLCIISGLTVYGAKSINHIPFWLAAGSALGLLMYALWRTFMRHAYSGIIYLVAIQMILAIIQQMGFAVFAHSTLAGIGAITVIIIIAYIWLLKYEKTTQHTSDSFNL